MRLVKYPFIPLLFGACALFVSLATNANPVQDTPTDATEAELLAGMFPHSCHFSGNFIQQKNIKSLPIPIKSSGDFFFSCDFGLVWNTSAPIQEALLYVNARKNYRVDERGEIEPLSGAARYAMSKVFLRLLKGDTEYFADEFAVSAAPDNAGLILVPESEFMKKGINQIQIAKHGATQSDLLLNINIQDTTGQNTVVTIDSIREYAIDNKQAAFEQCETIYPGPGDWCRILRSPDFYMR